MPTVVPAVADSSQYVGARVDATVLPPPTELSVLSGCPFVVPAATNGLTRRMAAHLWIMTGTSLPAVGWRRQYPPVARGLFSPDARRLCLGLALGRSQASSGPCVGESHARVCRNACNAAHITAPTCVAQTVPKPRNSTTCSDQLRLRGADGDVGAECRHTAHEGRRANDHPA